MLSRMQLVGSILASDTPFNSALSKDLRSSLLPPLLGGSRFSCGKSAELPLLHVLGCRDRSRSRAASMLRNTSVNRRQSSESVPITVHAAFVIRTTTIPYVNGEPFKDGEIKIIIWEGAGNRILWPPEKQRNYISASKAGGLISSPPLAGIESDEIAIMALVRFGGANGRTHQVTGLFPLPDSDEFKLRVYVDLKAASVVVRAANIDAITRDARKARAKLAKEAKIIDAMIRSGTTVRPLDEKAAKGGAGEFRVELEHYTGTLGFDPRPKRILGRQ